MGSFLYRLMGAAMLDAGMYENVERDRRTTWQAAAVVLLSSAAAGVGSGGVYGPRFGLLVGIALFALLVWLSWAVLTLQIGTRWFAEPATSADTGQLLRTLGFAASPGLLQAFAIFPRVSTVAFLVSWIWMLAAMVVAVKHALDFRSGGRAVAVCVMAAGICLALALVIGLLFGPNLN